MVKNEKAPGGADDVVKLREDFDKSKRYMWIAMGAAALGVIALVVTLVLVLVNKNPEPAVRPTAPVSAGTTPTAPSTPEPMDLDGAPTAGIMYNPTGASLDNTVTVSIFSDFLCSWCMKFETTYGDMLSEMANEGKIVLDYHPLAFLSDESNYSARTAAATFAVGALENDKLPAFNRVLFENWPESSAPLTDDQIAEVARQAGISDETIAAFVDPKYKGLSDAANAQSKQDVITGTPSIMFDGARYKLTRDDFDSPNASVFTAMLNSSIEAKKG